MTNQNDSFLLPSVIETSLVFKESILSVLRDKLQIGQRPPYYYYSLATFPFSVAVLAITSDGKYVLNKEYRHPTGHVLLGCPGGYFNQDEDACMAAERELLEETGYQAKSYEVIGAAYPYAGISGQKIIYVKAVEANLVAKTRHDISEVIEAVLMTSQELIQAIKLGAEVDGTLCTALFFHHQCHNQK